MSSMCAAPPVTTSRASFISCPGSIAALAMHRHAGVLSFSGRCSGFTNEELQVHFLRVAAQWQLYEDAVSDLGWDASVHNRDCVKSSSTKLASRGNCTGQCLRARAECIEAFAEHAWCEVQAWRQVLVQERSSTGFTAPNQAGACRSGAKIASLQLAVDARGVRSIGVQCAGAQTA